MADRDFGELIFRQVLAVHEVVPIRLAGLSQSRKVEILSSVIRERGSEIPDALSVVTPSTIRIRHKP